MRFRDNSKWRTFAWCSACFSSSWSRLQTIVDEASSSVFRKQNAPQVAPQRSRWTRFASRKLLSAYSHILTWFWAVLLTTRVTWACRLLVACIGALLVKLHPPSTSGTRLKVENPETDPRRYCLDWRAHQVWWINSVRKDLGNIFEGWSFFCYVFTHCWLLPWRTKLKLTPYTKLAGTKWKTSKTALKTDLQSWTNFQWAFLQLMYLSTAHLRSVCVPSQIHCPRRTRWNHNT